MALALLDGETIYKIFSTDKGDDFEDLTHCQAVFIKQKDGDVRSIAHFTIGGLGTYEERIMSTKEADKTITDMARVVDGELRTASLYDFTGKSDVDEQLASMKKVPSLQNLAIILEIRRHWMII
jgi:hypothetical protein